jgi:hypothetical protein
MELKKNRNRRENRMGGILGAQDAQTKKEHNLIVKILNFFTESGGEGMKC